MWDALIATIDGILFRRTVVAIALAAGIFWLYDRVFPDATPGPVYALCGIVIATGFLLDVMARRNRNE